MYHFTNVWGHVFGSILLYLLFALIGCTFVRIGYCQILDLF